MQPMDWIPVPNRPNLWSISVSLLGHKTTAEVSSLIHISALVPKWFSVHMINQSLTMLTRPTAAGQVYSGKPLRLGAYIFSSAILVRTSTSSVRPAIFRVAGKYTLSDPQMALKTMHLKAPGICITRSPDFQMSIGFTLRPADFESETILKQVH